MALLLVVMPGCARYQLNHDHTKTTTLPDGTAVVETSLCRLSILSSREVRDGDVAVSEDCALSSGAHALGMNERAIQMIREIIKAVP